MHAHRTEESKSPAPPASSPLPIAPLQLTRRVTLRQLEVFVEAARQLNFSRVAEAMHLTQPAVSMQIRQVEQAVGLPLFDRQGRQKRLNEAGNLLLHYASRMLGELRDAEHGLQAMKGLAGGSVAVGLVSTAQYFAPRLVAEFTHAHPHIDVRFVLGNRGQLVRLLQENQIDLAVMGRPPPEMDTASEPLAANPHVLVAGADHPFCDARDIDMHALRHESFLIREPGSGTRMVMEELFHNHLFKPERLVVLDSNEAIKQSVMASLGVSLLSLHTLALELRAHKIVVLDVQDTPMQRTWHMVRLRKRQLSPPALAFQRFLIEETQAYLKKAFARLPRRPAAKKR